MQRKLGRMIEREHWNEYGEKTEKLKRVGSEDSIQRSLAVIRSFSAFLLCELKMVKIEEHPSD